MLDQDQEWFIDGIAQLDAGMNSGIVPQLIPANQTSFSTNCTHRGGFIRSRPGYREMDLQFNGDAVLEAQVTRALFQAAGYYKPDYGSEKLIAQIAGRSFTFTPDEGTNVVIEDVTIPGDPNSATSLQGWGWQSELFWIWMDGEHLPTFYDGTSTRRSFGPSQVLAVTQNPFTVPAIGSSVQVTLTQVYNGQYNIPVLVGTAQYTLLQYAAGTNNARLTRRSNNPSSPAGTVMASGSQVLVMPSRVGALTSVLGNLAQGFPGTCPGGARIGFVNISYPANNNGVGISGLAGPSSAFSSSPGSGPTVTIANSAQSDQFKILAIAPNSESQPGYTIQVQTLAGSGGAGQCFTASHNPGELVTLQNSSPNTPVGVLAATFVQPAQNGTVDIEMDAAYTGGPQIVWIGNDQYIIEVLPVPPNNIVTLVNINDTEGNTVNAGTNILSIPELPAGRMGDYGLGRNAVSLLDGRSFMMGDIVGGSSGTITYANRDAVLRATENTFLAGGGNFVVPGSVGNIRSMRFAATLDASLGQGPLQVGTPTVMFSCMVPVDRLTWQGITNPILTESLKGNGPLSQDATILLNSDIGFRSVQGFASLILARRDFNVWGNVGQSREMQTVYDLDNKALLQYGSQIEFDNRSLMTCFPTQGSLGVYHQGLVALNFDPISSLRGKAASIYDGLWTGINVFKLVKGLFNGRERAFAFAFDGFAGRMRLYELLRTEEDSQFDNESMPITYSFESSSLFRDVKGKGAFDEVQLLDGEIYLSEIRGVVTVESWFRPDYSECWTPWTSFSICANNRDTSLPRQYRNRIGLGEPTSEACDPTNDRPYRQGVTFQVRFQITGSCKFMGALFKACSVAESQFALPQCDDLCEVSNGEPCEPCKDQGSCLRFPIVLYNFGDNKKYSNLETSFPITCPNGEVKTIVVPAGTVTYTLPFPVGYSGPYPPLVLGCVNGGVVVRTLQNEATQEQIDEVVEDMINVCAQAWAEANADCAIVAPSNGPVYFDMNCAEGETIDFTGTLPDWITLDTVNNRLVGAGGVFSGTDTDNATEIAQAALDAFANDSITSGDLTCTSPPSGPTLIIQGYVDGLFANATGDPPAGEPVWDGKLTWNLSSNWSATGDAYDFQMSGGLMAQVCLSVTSLRVVNSSGATDTLLWEGEHTAGAYPLGTYTRIGGEDGTPASVELIANADPIAGNNSVYCDPI